MFRALAWTVRGAGSSPAWCYPFSLQMIAQKRKLISFTILDCLQSRKHCETIMDDLQPPITAKGCRSFVGIVNFLSMFCPELQKLLHQFMI